MKKCIYHEFNGDKELYGTYNPFENKTEFVYEFNEMQYGLFEIFDGVPLEEKNSLESTQILKPITINKDLNKLVLDKVSISINDSEYDERDYSIKKTLLLYNKINGNGNIILKAKYDFYIEDIPKVLYATGEYQDALIYVNDQLIESRLEAFHSGAKRADIIKYIKKGLNTLVVEKNIDRFNDPLLGKNVFQSISNVFSFPFYIESIILEGDFKVSFGKYANLYNYVIAEDDFRIVKDDSIINYDLTMSGYPFYSGKLSSIYEFDYDLKEEINLEITNTFANSNLLKVNNHEIPLNASLKADITKYLNKGKNKIELIEYQGLRNVYGPFHHKYGKHYYTGPSVFEGYAEWQDFVIYPELKGSTYIDEYSFVHLYVPNVILRKKMKGPLMATIRDVAKEAGVSLMTVSRVINEPSLVKQDTVDKVNRAIKKLGYRPNLLAKSLAKGKSKTIGIILSNMRNQAFVDILSTIEREAYKEGLVAINSDVSSSKDAKQALNMLLGSKVDGIIILPLDMDMTEKKDFKDALDEIHNFYHYLYEIKKNENINVVTISQKIGDIPNIDFDFKEQSSITMNYLFNKGYKDISFINAKFKDGLWQTKEDVYLKMMKDKNFDDYINIEYCNVDINSGYEAMKSLLDKRIPKAVYCANDVIACGAIQAILEKDLKIPKDIAVIGNDDMQLCEYIYPKLTSINLGTKELGIKAFKSLLSIINNDSISDSLMTPYLVERKTV